MTIEQAITKLRNAAELISEAVNELSALLQSPETVVQSAPTDESPTSALEANKAPTTEAKPVTPNLSFEDVRGILADIARAGNREGVKSLLEKYGASKLSTLNPKYYADILKDAEVLRNA